MTRAIGLHVLDNLLDAVLESVLELSLRFSIDFLDWSVQLVMDKLQIFGRNFRGFQ
jgi:hypothetical protein